MLFAIFVIGIALGASGLSRRLLSTLDTPKCGPAERLASVFTVGIALWIALSWVLSFFRAIHPIGLVLGACAVGALGFYLLWPFFRGLVGREFVISSRATAAGVIAACSLPALWVVLIGWRGAMLPPLNHDAFAYHLPKAVLILKEGGYTYFPSPDARISYWPTNYELLLADVLALTGEDTLTAWVSVLSYVYFLVVACALAERWWGTGAHVLGAGLLTGSMPIALLQSGQHKNDLLICAMVLSAILWTARWAAGGGRMALLLAAVCLLMTCGTKLSGAFACGALAPFFVLGAARRWREGGRPTFRLIAAGSGVVFALSLLLGLSTYLVSFRSKGTAIGVDSAAQLTATYGDWSNLWQFPYLAFAAPFAKNNVAIWVPWRSEYWFWARYDPFFSNYGAAVTLVLILVPLVIWRFGRTGEAKERFERLIGTVMVLMFFLLILPIHTQPEGFFASFVRYTMVIGPVIASWSLVPWLRASFALPRWSWVGWLLLGGIGINYGREAYLAGTHDNTAPLSYVKDLMLHPEHRRVPYGHPFRAAFYLDRVAGPNEHVAFDGDFDSWIYPLYGEALTRSVTFLLPSKDGPATIPDDADWVVVDRSWSCFFGDPEFKTFKDWWTRLGRGKPTAADVRITQLVADDRRFRLVYSSKQFNQSVFKRLRSEDHGAAPQTTQGADP